jgi:hypothetical protein
MKELDRYDYEHDNGLITWLREKIEVMDYALIKEKLITITK